MNCLGISQTTDSSRGHFYTRAQEEAINLALEHNKLLRAELRECDSSKFKGDSLSRAIIREKNNVIDDLAAMFDKAESQIRKLEHANVQPVVIDTRKWFEIPAAVGVGAVVGILLKILFFK